MTKASQEETVGSAKSEGIERIEKLTAPVISALDDMMDGGANRCLKHIKDHIDNYFYQKAIMPLTNTRESVSVKAEKTL